jgi:hypothetical protein
VPPVGAAPTGTPIPELTIGSSKVSPKDGMLMVYVPAGGLRWDMLRVK